MEYLVTTAIVSRFAVDVGRSERKEWGNYVQPGRPAVQMTMIKQSYRVCYVRVHLVAVGEYFTSFAVLLTSPADNDNYTYVLLK